MPEIPDINFLTMNSGECSLFHLASKKSFKSFTKFARKGFGAISSIVDGDTGIIVRGGQINGVATFVIGAEGHILATAFAAFSKKLEDDAWRAAEGTYLEQSDSLAVEMHAEGCPPKPDELPWVAAVMWPIVYRQKDPEAFQTEIRLAIVYSVLGAYALWREEGK